MVSSVFDRAGNPYLEDYSSSQSLLDMKIERLQNKVAEKSNAFTATVPDSTPNLEYMRSLVSGNTNSEPDRNLTGLASSGFRQSFENLGNIVSGESNPNNQIESDLAAGYSPEAREAYSATFQGGIDDIASGNVEMSQGNYGQGLANYGSALYKGASITPELIAESLSSIAEVGAGVVATALPEAVSSVAGVGVLGNRAQKIGKGVSSIYDSIKEAETKYKKGQKISALDKSMLAVAKTAKATSQTSLMTANVMQGMKESYIAENNKNPDGTWWAVNAVPAIALGVFQFGIFKKLYMPDVSKAGKKKAMEALRKHKKDIMGILDPIPKKFSKRVVDRVYDTVLKMGQAAGMEATQEYLQTWHEILATKVDSFDLQSFEKEWLDKNNQAETLFGGLAGGLAGGGTKGITKVPRVVLGTAKDVTLSAVETTAQVAKNASVKSAAKLLSKEDLQKAKEQYDRDKVIVDTFDKAKTAQVSVLETTSSLDQVTDEELKTEILLAQKNANVTDESMKDPEVFNEVINAVTAKLKGQVVKQKATLKASNFGRLAKSAGSNIVDMGKDVVNKVLDEPAKKAIKETADKATVIAQAAGTAAVAMVTNFQSSGAKGLLVAANEYTTKTTRTQVNKIKELANNTSVKELKETIEVIKKTNPRAAQLLEKTLQVKEKAKVLLENNTKTEMNKSNITKLIKDVTSKSDSKTVITSTQALALAKELNNSISNNRFADKESIKATRTALERYQKSTAYNNQEEGSLSKSDVKILTRKLVAHNKKLIASQRTVAARFTRKVATVAGAAAVNTTKAAYNKLAETTSELVGDTFNDVSVESVAEAVNVIVNTAERYLDDALPSLNALVDSVETGTNEFIEQLETKGNQDKLNKLQKTLKTLDDTYIDKSTTSANPDVIAAFADLFGFGENPNSNFITSLIARGINTEQKFNTFLTTYAPNFSIDVQNGNDSTVDLLTKNVFAPVLKALLDAKTKAEQEADSDTVTPSSTVTDTATDEFNEQHAINNDETDVESTKIDSITDSEFIAQTDLLGITRCKGK